MQCVRGFAPRLVPIGADNPPSSLERSLAGRAMDVYADKHKPDMQNPTGLTADNLTKGATEYRALRVLPRRRKGKDQPDAE